MILAQKDVFVLQTIHTTYAFYADECGNLIHLYYGTRLELGEPSEQSVQITQLVEALKPRPINQNGCSIIADRNEPNQCLDDVCLEISTRGKGDMREPLVEIKYADGSTSSDFRYVTCKLMSTKKMPEGLAGAYDDKGDNASEEGPYHCLIVTMQDCNSDVKLELIYYVFEECDCITRFARITNAGKENVVLKRAMSAQLDCAKSHWKVTTFHGDWAREMNRSDVVLRAGKYANDSSTGFSSNKANPFVMFGDMEVTEESGSCYGCNLIYSGNHRTCFEAGGHGKMRMITGINPDFFEWTLEPGKSFDTPEAVLTYSNQGYQGISLHMHSFVREHIVRGNWKDKERPVLLNSWEAVYFDVQERKLLRLAKAARDVGIELFVLDDGWFGKRNSDASSLGDWYDNKEKLPTGLAGISKKIRDMGMQFGIWVEPEMVSEDSDLYRKHPEWAVRIPKKEHALGRKQMLLDLSREDVQAYLIEQMADVFSRSQVSYVKWDMNRHMSDYYSQQLSEERQGEFSHRYIMGLYHILEVLTKRFPDILFEACASGGNRFDLGMLCYMPQIWASDCTDARSRAMIQNGYSYGYPQSVWGAHVSGCPNHQTLRTVPLQTRFAIASAGLLGLEYNLCDVKAEELEEINGQITLYKAWRRVLQFGQWYRLEGGINSSCENWQNNPYDTEIVKWNIVSQDKRQAVGITMQGQCVANYSHRHFQTRGLEEKKQYHFYNQVTKYDIRRMGDLINTLAPIHVRQDSILHDTIAKFMKLDGEIEDLIVSGALLNKAGIELADRYAGTGFEKNTALYQEYDARLYYIEEI